MKTFPHLQAACVALVVNLFGQAPTHAQQDVLTGQYLFNTTLVNPAAAGSAGHWQTIAMRRIQWAAFDGGAPSTSILSGHGLVSDPSLGVGATVAVDAIGINSTFEFASQGAYHMGVGSDIQLSFGLRGGLMQYRSQLALADVIDPADPLYQGTQLSAWIPRFGCGLMVRHPAWDAGISAPTLFVVDNALDGTITSFYRNHFYAHAGYHANVTPWLTLHPSVLFRSTPDVPSILDVNLLAEFTGVASVGVGWRVANSLTAITQFQITEELRIGYTAEFAATDIQRVAGGTHEVVLLWDFGKTSASNPSNFGAIRAELSALQRR